ncbi:MAG: M23 family metallopeptidase [Phormidesmis sp.]
MTQVAIASLMAPLSISAQATAASPSCPAALEQIQSYQVTAGDTLASLAATYRLQPTTLRHFNPEIEDDALTAGTTLLIPPFNGISASVAAGESWQSLADRYGSRADLLFEINGCVTEVPSRIFVPGVLTAAQGPTEAIQLPGYPLDQPASITLSYGWQPSASQDELVFNSGIAFAIPTVLTVRTVGSGTVAFAGDREGYGQLVVVNHAQGLQTRYANLNDISVTVGQMVTADTSLGRVGGSEPTFLYFEVRANSDSGWVAQDPGKYLPALELR